MTSPAAIFRGKTRSRERAERRLVRRSAMDKLHAAVAARARRCENPWCPAQNIHGALVMDHWLGGSGRRRQRQALATCWMLCFWCNAARTANWPDAAFWNRAFAAHCRKHGYPFKPHKEHR